jgi:cytochrome c oxidase subunit 4
MQNRESHIQGPGYGTYILAWLSLMVLTGLTVTASGMNWGAWSVFIALLVASFKSWIVLSFFMHLAYEEKIFKLMFIIAITTLAVILSVTFFDISFR